MRLAHATPSQTPTIPTNTPRQPMGSGWLVLSSAALAALVFADLVLGLNALRAAGLVGLEPSGGTAFQTLVHTLQENLIWLIVTGVGLAVVAISGMLMFGSQQAIVLFFRVGAGCAGILIVLPAILA